MLPCFCKSENVQCRNGHKNTAEEHQPWNRAPEGPWGPRGPRSPGYPGPEPPGTLRPGKGGPRASQAPWAFLGALRGPETPRTQGHQGTLGNSRVVLGPCRSCTYCSISCQYCSISRKYCSIWEVYPAPFRWAPGRSDQLHSGDLRKYVPLPAS